MNAREHRLVELLEAAYPAIAGRGPDSVVAEALTRDLPIVGHGGGEPDPVRPVADAWVVRSASTPTQATLGVPSVGTTFAVTGVGGEGVFVSAAGGHDFDGATVLFASGASRGRRTVITDVRTHGATTYCTVRDSITVGRGDTLLVLSGGLRSASQVLQNAAEATGNGTDFDVAGFGSVALQLTGTFVATVSFLASVDGTNFDAIQGRAAADGTIATTATATGLWQFDVAGVQKLRAEVSAYTSGSVTVTGRAVAGTETGASVALAGSKTSIVPTGLSAATIAASGSETGTAAFGFHVSQLTVTLAATYNASATGAVSMLLYGSPDGSAYDVDALTTTTSLTVASGAAQKTVPLDPGLAALPSIKAKVSNADGTYSATLVTVTFNWVP